MLGLTRSVREMIQSGRSQHWRTALEQANENVSGLFRVALLDRNSSHRVTGMRCDRINARLSFPLPSELAEHRRSVQVSTDAKLV